ncbi:MAG: 4Fe-4S ferredoxin [Candidatus Tectimicrobiota bacterium]|nr:MAG: 4Fe-4S ferredoxin [Candidatus Tectomicrobia bacterium]
MARWGMVIDLRRCVGCQTCTVACKLEHNLPPQTFWRYVIDAELGAYPEVERRFLPMQCMHCGEPPCVPVCPTGASQKRPDGIVWVDDTVCVGCGYCVVACPYRARHLVLEERWYFGQPTPPEQARRQPARLGVCTKCTFCMQRLDAAPPGAVPGRDPAATPVCATSCIANAIHFGDLDDPQSSVSQLLRTHKTVRLLEALGTDPAVYYIVG